MKPLIEKMASNSIEQDKIHPSLKNHLFFCTSHKAMGITSKQQKCYFFRNFIKELLTKIENLNFKNYDFKLLLLNLDMNSKAIWELKIRSFIEKIIKLNIQIKAEFYQTMLTNNDHYQVVFLLHYVYNKNNKIHQTVFRLVSKTTNTNLTKTQLNQGTWKLGGWLYY